MVAEIALTSRTGARSTSRFTIVDLPEPLGPDKTTMREFLLLPAPPPAAVSIPCVTPPDPPVKTVRHSRFCTTSRIRSIAALISTTACAT